MSRFHQKQLDMEKVAFRERFEEQERCQRQLQEQRLKLMREFKQQQLRNSETLAKIQSVYTHTQAGKLTDGQIDSETDRLTDMSAVVDVAETPNISLQLWFSSLVLQPL